MLSSVPIGAIFSAVLTSAHRASSAHLCLYLGSLVYLPVFFPISSPVPTCAHLCPHLCLPVPVLSSYLSVPTDCRDASYPHPPTTHSLQPRCYCFSPPALPHTPPPPTCWCRTARDVPFASRESDRCVCPKCTTVFTLVL